MPRCADVQFDKIMVVDGPSLTIGLDATSTIAPSLTTKGAT